ncbi:hypothetical protein BV20DRAFT_212390 [Pilatotrama ljubarskyi]|nr:hypothetical protein BV20DRAFT_212390 [Pilatotrama ljubarskyi]
MPARILPPSPDSEPALSPPRFHPRLPPHLSSSHLRRDTLDNRPPNPEHPLYALAMPAQVVRLDPSAARAAAAAPDQQPQPSPSAWSPVSHRVYPDPASIPPHWQVHPASAAPYRDPHPRPSLPQGNGGGGNGLPPWARPHTQLVNGAYTRVLQVQPFVTPPPQPIPHKVWILDCKSCGTFLTNRGMKCTTFNCPHVLRVARRVLRAWNRPPCRAMRIQSSREHSSAQRWLEWVHTRRTGMPTDQTPSRDAALSPIRFRIARPRPVRSRASD